MSESLVLVLCDADVEALTRALLSYAAHRKAKGKNIKALLVLDSFGGEAVSDSDDFSHGFFAHGPLSTTQRKLVCNSFMALCHHSDTGQCLRVAHSVPVGLNERRTVVVLFLQL